MFHNESQFPPAAGGTSFLSCITRCSPCVPVPPWADVVKYKGRLYFTEDEQPQEARPLPGSFVAFSVNGQWQGKAYCDVVEGTYYPAVSLYTHAHQMVPAALAVNFGEQPFSHSLPPEHVGWPLARPVSDMPGAGRQPQQGAPEPDRVR